MTYDAHDGYVVLFGGSSSTLFNDTWKFVNKTWTKLTPRHAPPSRILGSAVFDAADRYVMLFGGYGQIGSTFGNLNDTWKFVNGTWKNITPPVGPTPRFGSSMAYDAADGYVVLFGGATGGGDQDDTWTYSHGIWTALCHTGYCYPVQRDSAAMAYDPQLGYVVLFGGFTNVWGYGPYSWLNDTWGYVGGVWTHLFPNGSIPSSREGMAFSYDQRDKVLVLFGGFFEIHPARPKLTVFVDYGDTWTYG